MQVSCKPCQYHVDGLCVRVIPPVHNTSALQMVHCENTILHIAHL